MKHYLAFDLGASSGRAIIGTIDDNKKMTLQEVHRFANGPSRHDDGALYWEFDALVNELKSGIRKAVEIQPEISSIGIDTWGVDYVLFNRQTKQMIRLPYNYRDERTATIPEKVFQKISRTEIYQRTGMQYMTINTLYQLVAHKEQHPEDFEDSFLLFIPDALAYLFGGNATNEYTDASTSNLLDAARRDWDWDLIDKLELPRSIFAPLVQPCTLNGTLSQEICDLLGAPAIPLVKVGSHDTASAVAAVPAPTDRSWAYVSCGTWALLGAEIAEPIMVPAGEAAPFTNEGGLERTIRFLTNIMGSWLFQEVRRVWNEAGRNISFMEMERMAGEAEGFAFLINPNDQSFLTPGDMPEKIREFCRATGQGNIPDDAALLRAIYDSLALCFRSKLELLGEILNTRYECLNMVGGGTKDRRLLQATADALGIRVVGGPVEATATGNILAQAIAMKDIANLAEGREIVKNSFETAVYEPNIGAKAGFDAAMPRFQAICR